MEQYQQLANAFSKNLQDCLSTDELNDIRAKNETPEYSGGVCATHDYLDANELMSEAFTGITGRQMDPLNAVDVELWSKAWQAAKDMDFYIFGTEAQ